MEFTSAKIGSFSYEESDVYKTPLGLFGFPEEREFVKIQTENVQPFHWLQSLNSDWLAFLLCDPRLFLPDYNLQLTREDVKELHLEDANDSMIYCILTIADDATKITANLQGPLVFNLKNHLVKQVVVENAELRHPVFQEQQPA